MCRTEERKKGGGGGEEGGVCDRYCIKSDGQSQIDGKNNNKYSLPKCKPLGQIQVLV